MSDTVFIRDLRLQCIVGIHDHERTGLQELVINVIMRTDFARAAQSGDLSFSVDYSRVAADIKEYVQTKKALLLETLAYDLSAMILNSYNVREVTVKLEKTQAVENCAGVGVEVTKQRTGT